MSLKIINSTLLVVGILVMNGCKEDDKKRTPAPADQTIDPSKEAANSDGLIEGDSDNSSSETAGNSEGGSSGSSLSQADCDKTNQVLSADGKSCIDKPVVAQPPVEPIVVVEPIVAPAVEPIAAPAAEPIAAPAVEPIAPPAVEPIAPPAVEPIAPPAVEPIAPPAVEPIAPPAVEPIAPPAVEPIAPPAVEPITPPAVEPITPPAVEPITPPAVEPIAPPAVEPIAPPAVEPVLGSDLIGSWATPCELDSVGDYVNVIYAFASDGTWKFYRLYYADSSCSDGEVYGPELTGTYTVGKKLENGSIELDETNNDEGLPANEFLVYKVEGTTMRISTTCNSEEITTDEEGTYCYGLTQPVGLSADARSFSFYPVDFTRLAD